MARSAVFALICLTTAGCATGGGPGPVVHTREPSVVLDRAWQWVSTITPIEKITVPDPARYTIRLTADHKVQARFDCNGGRASRNQ